MNARRITGALLIIVGFFMVICTADGSAHEFALRFIGVAFSFAGVLVGGYARREDA